MLPEINSTESYELSVIGRIFQEPHLLEIIDLEEQHFHTAQGRAVWSAVRALEKAEVPVAFPTVEARLVKLGTWDAIGGYEYLTKALDLRYSTSDLDYYAKQLRDRAKGREALVAISGIVARNRIAEIASGEEIIAELSTLLSTLDADVRGRGLTVGQIVKERLSQLEKIAAGEERKSGFPTGVESLDAAIGGWQSGIVSVVAARPGVGKSSLALSTTSACSAAGIGVHVFSMEDTRSSYADRVMSRKSQVPATNIRTCDLNKGQVANMSEVMGTILNTKNWIVEDEGMMSADEIIRAARQRRREIDTKVVIVDYIGLVKPASDRMTPNEAATDSIRKFAAAARKDKQAYLVLSQLNRKVEYRTDKRPISADLKDSGTLEEVAKCIVMMHRGSMDGSAVKGIDYGENEREITDDEFAKMATLIITKNSNGQPGEVRARWDGPTTKIW